MKRLVLSMLGLLEALVCAAAQPQQVVLLVAENGQYSLQGRPVADSELKERLQVLRKQYASIDFHVVGSPEASYERVALAIRAAREAGLPLKQGLLSAPLPEPGQAPGAGR